jgi:glycosyltransferase involved in cell wall biosynthesis
MEKADMVVVSSSRLYETKHRYNPNTFLVTHGVDVAHFRNACLPTVAPPADCAELKGPVIGFFGLIADWVDLEVVRYLAASRPNWSLLLIGEVQTDTSALRELSNVHLLGRRSYESLPAYCKAFDVAILPFVVNELTVAANPLKLREYLAAGLPVVATPLPEVLKLSALVRMARTPEEFLHEIEALLNEGKSGPDPAVAALMERESWDQKGGGTERDHRRSEWRRTRTRPAPACAESGVDLMPFRPVLILFTMALAAWGPAVEPQHSPGGPQTLWRRSSLSTRSLTSR